jgi:hypothetical protein
MVTHHDTLVPTPLLLSVASKTRSLARRGIGTTPDTRRVRQGAAGDVGPRNAGYTELMRRARVDRMSAAQEGLRASPQGDRRARLAHATVPMLGLQQLRVDRQGPMRLPVDI